MKSFFFLIFTILTFSEAFGECQHVVSSASTIEKIKQLPNFAWSKGSETYLHTDENLWIKCSVQVEKNYPYGAVLKLGRIRDHDEVYFNGSLIGSTFADSNKGFWPFYDARSYYVPESILKKKDSIVFLRVKTLISGVSGFKERNLKLSETWSSVLPRVTDLLPGILGLIFLAFLSFFPFSTSRGTELVRRVVPLGCLIVVLQFFNSFYLYRVLFDYAVFLFQVQIATTFFTLYCIFVFVERTLDVKSTKKFQFLYALVFSFALLLTNLFDSAMQIKTLIGIFGLWGVPVLLYGSKMGWQLFEKAKSGKGAYYGALLTGGIALIIFGGYDILILAKGDLPVNAPASGVGFLLFLIFSSLSLLLLDKADQISSLGVELDLNKERAKVARQVAHDLKSPLTAMDVLLKNLNLRGDQNLVMAKKSLGRIQDIVDHLSRTGQVFKGETQKDVVLFSLISSVINEKEILDNKLEIKYNKCENALNHFVDLPAPALKRILSNLIDNSIDAGANKLLISQEGQNDNIVITLEDNGCGIPLSVINKLNDSPFTFNKIGGNGIGLRHAKEWLQKSNGSLEIESDGKTGTKVLLTIPKKSTPTWFTNKISVSEDQLVLVLDDDPSILEVWRTLIPSKNKFFFSTTEELDVFLDSLESDKDFLLLSDYEILGETQTGLDLIERRDIGSKSILITSYYDDPIILSRVKDLRAKLIPKSLLSELKVELTKPKESIIHLEDDKLLRAAWKLEARDKGHPIFSFGSSEELLKDIDSFEKNITLYIDEELGEERKGSEIAKDLFEAGFENIYLSTGHPAEMFSGLTHIKGVIGKEPPFGLNH